MLMPKYGRFSFISNQSQEWGSTPMPMLIGWCQHPTKTAGNARPKGVFFGIVFRAVNVVFCSSLMHFAAVVGKYWFPLKMWNFTGLIFKDSTPDFIISCL